MKSIVNHIDKLEIVNMERHQPQCGKYKDIVLDIYCVTVSNRWEKFELIPFEQIVPPENGEYHYKLVSYNRHPECSQQETLRVTTNVLRDAPSDLEVIVVHSKTNSISISTKTIKELEDRCYASPEKSHYITICSLLIVAFFILIKVISLLW